MIFIRHLQIENNREGFTKLQMTLANLQKTTGENIQIALEDTGHYCFNILHFISFGRKGTQPTAIIRT